MKNIVRKLMKNGKRLLGVQAKIMLIGLLMLIMTSNLLAGLIYGRYKHATYLELEETMEQFATESSILVGKILEVNRKPLESLAAMIGEEPYDISTIMEIISEYSVKSYETIAYVDLSGTSYYLDGTHLDLSDREYVKLALSGKNNYSNLLISRVTNEPVIMCAVPVFDCHHQVTGALIGRLSTSSINTYIDESRYGEDGFSYLTDGTGLLIEFANSGVTSHQSRIKDENFYLQLTKEVHKDNTGSEAGFGVLGISERKVWLGYCSVPETDWILYLGGYEDTIIDGMIKTRNLLIFLIIIFDGLSFISMYYLSRAFTKPILRLEKAFDQATEGDLNVRIEVESNDEIGKASVSFNRMMDRIRRMTYNDPVTNLPNQGVLLNELNRVAGKQELQITLILMSVDNLGVLYETVGNGGVDALKQSITKKLKYLVEGEEEVRIYKGRDAEFLLCLFQNDNKEHALHIARSILSNLRDYYIIQDKKFLPVISIGIDFLNESWNDHMFTHVVYAQNTSKVHGGNRITIYDEHAYKEVLETRGLGEELLEAIKNNEFYLLFQPIVDMNTECIVSVEALIRWNHPKRGLISADVFIKLAEEMNVIHHIDYWVIEEVMKNYHRDTKELGVSINIAAKTFEREGFVDYLIGCMNYYQVGKNLIQLELTERDLIQDVDGAILKINELHEAGISISIDDFGVGYSSLSYIVKLPVDCVKIDKGFIQSMDSDGSSKILVSMILTMCKALNFKVIAEGIESKVVKDTIRSMGCVYGQGYYFSKPLASDELKKAMNTKMVFTDYNPYDSTNELK